MTFVTPSEILLYTNGFDDSQAGSGTGGCGRARAVEFGLGRALPLSGRSKTHPHGPWGLGVPQTPTIFLFSSLVPFSGSDLSMVTCRSVGGPQPIALPPGMGSFHSSYLRSGPALLRSSLAPTMNHVDRVSHFEFRMSRVCFPSSSLPHDFALTYRRHTWIDTLHTVVPDLDLFLGELTWTLEL